MSAPLVIVADPPWLYSDSLPGAGRGAAKHYPCMSVIDICNYELAQTARTESNAVLFLWQLPALYYAAWRVATAWGFEIKSDLEWRKLTKHGKPAFGMGRTVRRSHETCLICVRGRARPDVRNQRSFFYAPVREHSRKPAEFYEIVERMYPRSVKVELFSRTTRAGWFQNGNQLGRWT